MAGERRPGGGPAPRPQGQRGQVQADWPALGPPDEVVDVGVREPDLGPLQQQPGSSLSIASSATPSCRVRPHSDATGSGGRVREASTRRDPSGSRTASSATASRHSWLLSSSTWSRTRPTGWVIDGPSRGQPGHDRRGHQRPAGPGAEHVRVDRLDPIQRGGKVGQQHRRVVVVVVDRDPGHPPLVSLSPLGQQGRLAVAGRGDHTDQPWRGRRAAGRPARSGARSPAGPRVGGAWPPPAQGTA